MYSCEKEDNIKKENEEVRPHRTYKDTLFRMLFRGKKNLLSLYNAVNGTAYTDVGGLEITTLENADLYSSVLVKIPTPRFVIFYNGMQHQPEQKILKLSDAFEKELETPELELIVTMYNINFGQNPELLNTCQTLKEYAQYVSKVRECAEKMPFAEAVETAVDHCIKNGILADFLLKNRAEAIEMSIFEYDEEKHLKNEREYAYKEGKKEGRNEGKIEGVRIVSFILKCNHQGESKEKILQKLQESYSISQEEAESYYLEIEDSIK